MEKDSVTGERCTEVASVTGLSLASSLWWGDHFNPQKSSPDSRILGSIGWNLHFILRNSVFPYHGKINLSRVRKDLYSSFKKNKIMPSGSLNKDEAWVVITGDRQEEQREQSLHNHQVSVSPPLFWACICLWMFGFCFYSKRLQRVWWEDSANPINSSKNKMVCLFKRTSLDYCLEVNFLKRIYK